VVSSEPGIGQTELFVDVVGAPPAGGMGRAETALVKALGAADHLDDIDAGLVGAALVAARALDRAELQPGTKGGYLVAQLLKPYQEALAGLRLPQAIAPAGMPGGVPKPGAVPADLSQLLGDQFGAS
jgi:hypothetical protein